MVLGLVAGAAWQRARRTAAPIGGLLLAGAFLAGLYDTGTPSTRLVAGLVALAAAGLIRALLPFPTVAGAVLAVPGAILLATAPGVPTGLPALVVIGGVVLGGTLVADFDARWQTSGMGPVLFAISVAGVYATVPETGRAMVLLGAAVFLPLLGWPFVAASLGGPGAYAATGALLWVAAVDGQTRTSSVIGAAACLGLMAVEPLARWLSRGGSVINRLEGWGRRWQWVVAAAAAHLALVYVASRVAGLRRSTGQGTVIAAAALGAAVVAAMLFAPSPSPEPVREDAGG